MPATPSCRGTGVSVARVSYHGWTNCYLIANGSVEAVVVPSIGRVMQLRLAGETEGVFWENRALDGQLHDAASEEWINFGGDKCWPAPQSGWFTRQGRDWPPPATFDSRPLQAMAVDRGVVLTSSIDPDFGIQFVRRVELDPQLPVMRIRTEFHKILGSPVRVGVWTITQMPEPERIFMLLPEGSRFGNGYVRLMEGEPNNLRMEGRMLSLTRHPRAYVKIGTESSSLVWMGTRSVVRVDTDYSPGEYPDGGCVTEVYTNPDPLPYVELEVMSPLADMCAGDCIDQATIYSVTPRPAGGP